MDNTTTPVSAKRDRSPAYPTISLKTAVERLAAMDEYFKRHPAPVAKIGLAWGIKCGSSQASSAAAALKAYGLVDYERGGADLKATVTEDGRNYLRAQQDGIKREILRRAALNPKAIAKYWQSWGADRPPDAVCLDELIIKDKFSDVGAKAFLKVYDATMAFAGLSNDDKLPIKEQAEKGAQKVAEIGDFIQWSPSGVMQFAQHKRIRAIQQHDGVDWVFVDGSDTGIPMSEISVETKGNVAPNPPIFAEEVRMAAAEREWLRGPLSKDASYRLIVTGDLGPKDIGKLIKLLEAQKAVLADDDEDPMLKDV